MTAKIRASVNYSEIANISYLKSRQGRMKSWEVFLDPQINILGISPKSLFFALSFLNLDIVQLSHSFSLRRARIQIQEDSTKSMQFILKFEKGLGRMKSERSVCWNYNRAVFTNTHETFESGSFEPFWIHDVFLESFTLTQVMRNFSYPSSYRLKLNRKCRWKGCVKGSSFTHSTINDDNNVKRSFILYSPLNGGAHQRCRQVCYNVHSHESTVNYWNLERESRIPHVKYVYFGIVWVSLIALFRICPWRWVCVRVQFACVQSQR